MEENTARIIMVLVVLFFVCESGESPWETWSCGEKAIVFWE